MEPHDPNMPSSLILKFKEAAKAAEEDYEYSDYDDDDNDDEEDDAVKKKKLVVSGSGSVKKRANVNVNVTGGSGGGMVALVCCQVEKCGVDLKEAKKYYRRHKVCEVHAKSPLVVVDGMRQRFCQQCSRFHDVSEFDEMRRSCRSRLAGHNERRRKLSSETQKEEGSTQTPNPGSSHERDRRIPPLAIRPEKHIQFQ